MITSTLWTWLLLGFAACLALGGIAVIALALFRDRARGRRRCPRCWYDMSAARDLRCTECGREARSARALLKTRRHWKRAMVGVVMVLAAGIAGTGQQVIEHGWMRATPGWGYIAAMPWLEPQSKGMKELTERVQHGELREWEYRYLIRQCVNELRTARDSARKHELLGLLTDVQIGQSIAAMNMPYASWARTEDIDNEVVVNAIVSLIDDTDESVRLTVIGNIRYYTTHGRVAIPALLGRLDDDPTTPIPERICVMGMFFGEESRTAYFPLHPTRIHQGSTLAGSRKPWLSLELVRDLKACGTDIPRAVTILSSALDSTNSADRAIAIWALSFLAPDDPGIAVRILACRLGADLMVRQAVMDAITRMPPSEDAIAAIRDELRGSDSAIGNALNAARVFGPAGHELADAIRPHMSGFWSNRAAEAWIAVGGEHRVALDVLLTQLRNTDRSKRQQALRTLTTLRIHSTDSLVHIEPLLTATPSDPDIKFLAARAYARLGGSSQLATQAMLDTLAAYAKMGQPATVYAGLFQVAEEGLRHVPSIAPWLGDDDSNRRLIAVRCLSESGADGVPYLPQLRGLRKDADPDIAEAADHAVRQIEWEIRYPEKAAKLREQRRR